jgi:membrane protein YqaA with SNARE-associated domain
MNDSKAVSVSRIISNGATIWFLSIISIFAALFFVQLRYLPDASGDLVKYFLYMGLSNALLPLPTNPVLLLAGKSFHPFIIAFAGSIATCIANMNEYLLLNPVFACRRLERMKETRTYKYFRRIFERSPFLSLALANTLPIPVDPVRWMSISVGYNKKSYLLATFFGRFPRYLLIAWVGYHFQFSLLQIVLIAVCLAVIFYLLKNRNRRKTVVVRPLRTEAGQTEASCRLDL